MADSFSANLPRSGFSADTLNAVSARKE